MNNVISPMLAREYDKYSHKLTFPCFSQPKLDGIRCLATKDGVFSRYGNPFVSVPHIRKHLEHFFATYPDMVLDGELYCQKHKDNFPQLCSIVKTQKVTPELVQRSQALVEFWIFDCWSPVMDGSATYRARESFLSESPIPWSYEVPLRLVSSFNCLDEEDVNLHYDELIEAGFEGQMLRNNVPYRFARTFDLLKRKPHQKDRCVILDVLEGEGKWRNMVGAFVLLHPETNKQFTAALSDSDEQRINLWEKRNEVKGKWAEVVFQYLTPHGVPRHPRVKAIIW